MAHPIDRSIFKSFDPSPDDSGEVDPVVVWTVPLTTEDEDENGGAQRKEYDDESIFGVAANEAMNTELAKMHGLGGLEMENMHGLQQQQPYWFQFQVNPDGNVKFVNGEQVV